jgi:AcrR family transcriptional regulator
MRDTREAGGARRLRADARRNRAQILAAARDVFVEQGPGAPLEDISRRAGTGIATLYRRFPDRRSLMRAVVIDALERTTEEVRDALAEEPTAFAALVRYMHRTLDVRIAAVIPTLLDEVSMEEEEIRRISDEGTRYLQQMIDAAQDDGALRPGVTFGDIGMMIVRLSRPLPGPVPRDLNDQLAHRHLDLLIHGLSTDATGATRAADAGRPAVEGPAMTLADLRGLQSQPRPTTATESGSPD